MTDPTPTPTTQELDQDVIDAGEALIDAETAEVRDPDAIEAARVALRDAYAARWPNA